MISDNEFLELLETYNVSYSKGDSVKGIVLGYEGDDVLVDKESKSITIRIDHAYLESIEIDPEKIIINDVKEGLLAWGDIKLTVRDYNSIEKELRNRMMAEFNTAQNAQDADDTALRMVKEIYEPLVKAVDAEYDVRVEFK